MKRLLLLSVILLNVLFASSQNPYVTTAPFLSGLSNPLAMAHCGDSRVFIVQKNGIIRIADAITGALNPTAFLNIDPRVGSSGSEQGLLGMAFHPDYKNNGYFFVNYTNNSGNTTISRFSVDPADSNLALPNSEVILHVITQPYSNHNGGNLAFGPDGYLFIGMGDGGSGGDPLGNGQNTNVLLAKMLRIDVSHGDSSMVPPTNPFINSAGYKPQIWHIGMRNPWRYSFDRKTGDLWIGDVGQGAVEEIDFQPANSTGGENWGWRCYEGNAAYNTAGCQPQNTYDSPIYTYTHSGGNCSVSGGYIYRGAKYGNLNGYYLFTDYCVGSLRTLKKTEVDTSYLQHSTVSGFIVGFGQDVYGELYAFNMAGGTVLRIEDTTSCAPAVMLSDKDTLQLCDTVGTISTAYYPGMIYSWYKDNVQLSDTTASIRVNADGNYSVIVLNPQTTCFASDSVYVKMGNPATQIAWIFPPLFPNEYCAEQHQNGAALSASPTGGTFFGRYVQNDSIVNWNDIIAGNFGDHLLEYVYTDSNGCVYRDLRKIKYTLCVGLSEYETKSFGIYPNPAKEEVTVTLNAVQNEDVQIELQDASGRKVYSSNILSGVSTFNIQLTGLESGSYIVTIRGKEVSQSKPLMIVR